MIKKAFYSVSLFILLFFLNGCGFKPILTGSDYNILDKNIVDLISYVNKSISKSEIRRLLKGKGIKINNEAIIPKIK